MLQRPGEYGFRQMVTPKLTLPLTETMVPNTNNLCQSMTAEKSQIAGGLWSDTSIHSILAHDQEEKV